ncbi:MAG: hypothetical protein JWQ35_1404, partial [Bacteriovoracaceae bacterium]|nr:hypothetical protein [Bacteriovoracaceae bacterium]
RDFPQHFAYIPSTPRRPTFEPTAHQALSNAKDEFQKQLTRYEDHFNQSKNFLLIDPKIKDSDFENYLSQLRSDGSQQLQSAKWLNSSEVTFLADHTRPSKGARNIYSKYISDAKKSSSTCVGTMSENNHSYNPHAENIICVGLNSKVPSAEPRSNELPKINFKSNSIGGISPERASCVKDKKDPYDPGVVLKGGRDNDKCADTSTVRTPVIIEETNDSITFANFLHGRSWWIATIDKRGIDEVYLQTPVFKLPLGITSLNGIKNLVGQLILSSHVELRFVMNKNSPVQLRSQTKGDTSTATVDSFEVNPEPFNGNRIATEFVSEFDRKTDSLGFNWYDFTAQTELSLDREGRKHLFETAVKHSLAKGYKDFFGLLTATNCIITTVQILSEAFPLSQGTSPDGHISLFNFYDPTVGNSHKALIQLGLIDQNSAEFTLSDEFSSGAPFLSQMLAITNDKIQATELKRYLSYSQNLPPKENL